MAAFYRLLSFVFGFFVGALLTCGALLTAGALAVVSIAGEGMVLDERAAIASKLCQQDIFLFEKHAGAMVLGAETEDTKTHGQELVNLTRDYSEVCKERFD